MMTSLADVSLIYQKCCLPNYRIQLVTFIDFIFLPWCFFGSFFNYFSIININNVYCMFSKSAGNFLPTTNQWMNNTNQIISVNQLELCCHWVQNLQSEKICSLSLDQAIFFNFMCCHFSLKIYCTKHMNNCLYQCNATHIWC